MTFTIEMYLISRSKLLNSLLHPRRNCLPHLSGSSYKTQHSIASSTSTRAKSISARAKSAALEVRASFLKRKQQLRTAAANLDLEQQIAEVKTEQQIYEQELNNSAGNAEVGNLNDCREELVNINS